MHPAGWPCSCVHDSLGTQHCAGCSLLEYFEERKFAAAYRSLLLIDLCSTDSLCLGSIFHVMVGGLIC